MGFDRSRVVELVADFYRAREVDADTKYVVVPNLDDGLRMAAIRGCDSRLSGVPVRQRATTVQELDHDRDILRGVHVQVFRHVAQRLESDHLLRIGRMIVISAGGQSGPLGEAASSGLGWLIAADRTAIIVPTPVVRVAEGRPDVLHDDTGRMAVIWPDGNGYYFLQGSEFNKRLYFQVINHDLLIQDIAALDNADQRAIALQYLTFEQLVLDSDAQLLDRGGRGTALYRLPLPGSPATARRSTAGSTTSSTCATPAIPKGSSSSGSIRRSASSAMPNSAKRMPSASVSTSGCRSSRRDSRLGIGPAAK